MKVCTNGCLCHHVRSGTKANTRSKPGSENHHSDCPGSETPASKGQLPWGHLGLSLGQCPGNRRGLSCLPLLFCRGDLQLNLPTCFMNPRMVPTYSHTLVKVKAVGWGTECGNLNFLLLKFQHFLILFGTVLFRKGAIPLNTRTFGFCKTKKFEDI